MAHRKELFTLIELLMVVTVIALLAGIMLGITSYAHRKTDETEMIALIEKIKLLNEQYKQQYGFYVPAVNTELDKANGETAVYYAVPFNANFLKDAYDDIKTIHSHSQANLDTMKTKGYVLDIWGRPLRYRAPGKFNTGSFDIYSVGPDGLPGNHTNTNHGWGEAGKGDDIANFTNNR